MKRILIVGMTENPGGLEAVVRAYFNFIRTDKVRFDFLCNTNDKIAYEDEFVLSGSKVFHITPRSQNPIQFKKELNEFFALHSKEYSGIWVHLNTLTNIDYLKIAKKFGIKNRIIHSHNSKHRDNFLRISLHYLNRLLIHKYATEFWGCEQAALQWFYPKAIQDKAKLIPNAIDVSKYEFSFSERNEIRKSLGLTDEFVIGHVGRFHEQKNHSFIIEVFKSFHTKSPNSKLILVGAGEDEEKIKNKVRELGIMSSVYFVGKQSNMSAWLSAFDLFFFPSLYEGFSLSLLEAQANGLPILANSSVVPETMKINDNLITVSLEEKLEKWVKVMQRISNGSVVREEADMVVKIRKAGYDIVEQANYLGDIFESYSIE